MTKTRGTSTLYLNHFPYFSDSKQILKIGWSDVCVKLLESVYINITCKYKNMRTLTVWRYLNNGWFYQCCREFLRQKVTPKKIKSTPESISFENVEQTLLYSISLKT